MTKHSDAYWMRRAIRAAHLFQETAPNPRVGAVVVNHGVQVGTGGHQQYGGPHAEVHALQEAGDKARGADVFVTLEPCSHQGKTPPCADALVAAGVKRVVVGVRDPNPTVAGRGIARLRNAGIQVEVGCEAGACEDLILEFRSWLKQEPFGALKTAQTLDGSIADCKGNSRWITGAGARRDVHRLRQWYGLVVTGKGTLLADNPALTARMGRRRSWGNPDRMVMFRTLLPLQPSWQIADGNARTIVVAESADKNICSAWRDAGVDVWILPGYTCNPGLWKSMLWQNGYYRYLIEAGADINQWVLEQKLVQKIHAFVAPRILTGDALHVTGRTGGILLPDAVQLVRPGLRRVQQDFCLEAALEYIKEG